MAGNHFKKSVASIVFIKLGPRYVIASVTQLDNFSLALLSHKRRKSSHTRRNARRITASDPPDFVKLT